MKKDKSEEIRFQQFNLCAEELSKEGSKFFTEAIDLYGKWKGLKRGLLKKSCIIFSAQHLISGVPANIIVGNVTKQDFYQLASEYNLPYSSGNFYLKEREV